MFCLHLGFGNRGVEGKINSAKYARENNKPVLGICLGMQVMVIEYCRNVLGHTEANSTEFNENTTYPAIIFMPEINRTIMGGNMRLGGRITLLETNQSYLTTNSNENLNEIIIENINDNNLIDNTNNININDNMTTLAAKVYGYNYNEKNIAIANERHRHRYEVNPDKINEIENAGLLFTGKDETKTRMEIIELASKFNHPFYFGTQFHPEFKSRPNRPSPPFYAFLAVCIGQTNRLQEAGLFVYLYLIE